MGVVPTGEWLVWGVRPPSLPPVRRRPPEVVPGRWLLEATADSELDEFLCLARGREVADLLGELPREVWRVWRVLNLACQFVWVRLKPATFAAVMALDEEDLRARLELLVEGCLLHVEAEQEDLLVEVITTEEWRREAELDRLAEQKTGPRIEAQAQREILRRQRKLARTHRRRTQARASRT